MNEETIKESVQRHFELLMKDFSVVDNNGFSFSCDLFDGRTLDVDVIVKNHKKEKLNDNNK